MLNYLYRVLRLVAIISIHFTIINAIDNDRPKIGLVLSGGGARGLAHVGTLNMIDSLQIPIDYIVGTSMGGITGALYAIGYPAYDIERLIISNNWLEVFTDRPPRDMLPFIEKKDDGKYQLEFDFEGIKPGLPSGLIHGQKLSLLFSRLTYAYEHIEDFDDLPIPFRCVAVDLISGKEVILQKGSLAKAMRATMSIPSLFNPVEWGDSLLIDGGLLNNLPIDIAKSMGADIVIAVNAGRPKKHREELHTMVDILEQSIAIPAYIKEDENVKLADVLIAPDLADMNPADFSSKNIQKIVQIGKKAAHQNLEELVELKKSINLDRQVENVSGEEDIKRIHGITIAGNTSLPYGFIYDMLALTPNDIFVLDTLTSRLQNMKLSGYFELLDYEIQPVDNQYVKLFIRVKDKKKPIIHGVSIIGHKKLPFRFVYQLLNVSPLDQFDISIIEQRIMELYSLGYFETIGYVIQPVSQDSIRLVVQVKERSHNRLKVGLRYDDNYHLVGLIGFYGNNFLLPGFRIESTLQFSGKTLFQNKLYYPSQSLDLSLYPYIRTKYVDEPIHIYTGGRRIATYRNHLNSWGTGFGFLPTKYWDTEIEFAQEYVSIEPSVGDLELPTWDDQLSMLRISSRLDRLDNILIPRRGVLLVANYEWSSQLLLRSDISYQRGEITLNLYKSTNERSTFRILGYYGKYLGVRSLSYKYYYLGGPNDFVGVDYNELAHFQTSFFRFDYRYQYNRNLFFKLIFNCAPNYDGSFYPIKPNAIYGYGIGTEIITIFGPLEFIFSRGDKNVADNSQRMDNQLYFQIGNKF